MQSTRSDREFGNVVALVDVTRNHELAKLKDGFLSSMSHEMRTPLTNICAFAEILGQMGPATGDEWREFVQIVSGEGHRLKTMVDDVLECTRIEDGDAGWQIEAVDLSALVRTALADVEPTIDAKRIDVATDLDPAGSVRGDPERVARVLSRLLDNAIKFTPDEGRVEITTRRTDDLVEFAIADSGRGVAEEHREDVFEKFRQIGDHMTDKPAGAGLGLAISRRVIDALGGTMWCEDSPLGGARFRFVLPVAEQLPSSENAGVADRTRPGTGR